MKDAEKLSIATSEGCREVVNSKGLLDTRVLEINSGT